MNIHSVTIEFSLGDVKSLQQGIESLMQDIDLEDIHNGSKLYRDYRFVGVDEKGQSLGKLKVSKASFYRALASNDDLRPQLVAYIKKLTAYNFFVGSCFALVAPGEAQIIKDPVYALVELGEQYIDIYCDAFAASDRGYELGFDKPKRQFVKLYADSDQMSLLYAAMIIGRLTVYAVEHVLPKPPKSLLNHLSDRTNCDYFIKLCAAEYVRNELFSRHEKHHLGLASLKVESLVSDINELEEQFSYVPQFKLLSELTGRTTTDILQGLKEEVTSILAGSKEAVKPVLLDFTTPQWVIEQYNS